jgi:hypothetical protein
MSTTEQIKTLRHIEDALEVLLKHEGQLSASEISMKSMLLALRSQLRDLLISKKVADENEVLSA